MNVTSDNDARWKPEIILFHLHRQVGMKKFFTPTCLWRWNRVFRNVGI